MGGRWIISVPPSLLKHLIIAINILNAKEGSLQIVPTQTKDKMHHYCVNLISLTAVEVLYVYKVVPLEIVSMCWLAHFYICVGQKQPWHFQETQPTVTRGRMTEGGGVKQSGPSPWLRRFGSTDHPTVGGGGVGLSPLSVPQSQIHSWYPAQKRWQRLASGHPHPSPPPHSLTTIPHRAPGSCPSTWLRPSKCDPHPNPHPLISK